ncbi:hypothetical protein [Glutamicibacter sp. 0426]|uniref:nSTAND1 domain-containing NTPase n=1 Tax=Glutamicibacter sp. 0426 TaxID=1913445 RepID=UPI000A4CFB51|nr:hypothetical protein [Glutamicibacter sp. 0426]
MNDEGELHGFFFAIPRLTADATEKAKAIESKDSRFRLLTASKIFDLLQSRKMISPVDLDLVSDHALVIHESGYFCAALQIDPTTRTASQVLVKARSGGVNAEALGLLREHTYAQGLPVVEMSGQQPPTLPSAPHPAPIVIEVHGSHSDFEYQLPASPKYFIGRNVPVRELESHLTNRGGPFVLNAQSGWGKSSLALKVASKNSGLALVLDTRTAGAPSYVAASLRHAALAAVKDGLLILPDDASWATTSGALRSLEQATWTKAANLLIIFDQFENVFSDPALTTEFRDAALWNAENPNHVTLGFAWKTDYVDWIENHPYRLRDQIRGASKIVNLVPFGSREVETILRRLEGEVEMKLSRELRQRLREYSQGLPWLLKKLSGHVIRELQGQKTQEQLIGEALNVQDLFDSDLSSLSPKEREALSFVARFAPIQASEVTEKFTAGLVQSLLNQRLVVQVGEKLDTYWDIFRDYLNTGRVPIEDSYILRLSPRSVARLVSELLAHDGRATTAEIRDAWDTTDNVVWNSARELRQLGLAANESGQVSLIPEVVAAKDPEHELRQRVATALRRHRAFSEFLGLSERGQGRVELASLANRLREAFPAVEGTSNTWATYARTFAAWLEYAGLAVGQGSVYTVAPDGSPGVGSLTSKPSSFFRGTVFPTSAPGPALKMLRSSTDNELIVAQDKRKYFAQLLALGAVKVSEADRSKASVLPGLVVDGEIDSTMLLKLLEGVPGGSEGLEALRVNPSIRTQEMGTIFESANQANWSPSTKDVVGKSFFAWARAAGISTKRLSRKK